MQLVPAFFRSLFSTGETNEFFKFRFGRFYISKKGDAPQRDDLFLSFKRLYFMKRPLHGRWNRWGDDDVAIGNFVFAKNDPKWVYVGIRSACKDQEYDKCVFMIRCWKLTFRWSLPNIIKPHLVKVKANWDEATVKRMGRDWYHNSYYREYSIGVYDGHLSMEYGIQNENGYGDIKSKRKGWFLPWTQWRFIRRSLYDLDGKLFWECYESKDRAVNRANMDVWYEKKKECPSAYFLFEDYDGKQIVAKTNIEEMEHRKGEKWCSWLSWFCKPMITTKLEINFSEEVGKDKGGWKGGTLGHSCPIRGGQTAEDAFRDYCLREFSSKNGKYGITFIRRVDPSELILLVPTNCHW